MKATARLQTLVDSRPGERAIALALLRDLIALATRCDTDSS
jgi:hypothetical protein